MAFGVDALYLGTWTLKPWDSCLLKTSVDPS